MRVTMPSSPPRTRQGTLAFVRETSDRSKWTRVMIPSQVAACAGFRVMQHENCPCSLRV